jgi:hypothetical protein
MPDCRLVTIRGVGHSMNLESPALYAGYFGAWYGGPGRPPRPGHRKFGQLIIKSKTNE